MSCTIHIHVAQKVFIFHQIYTKIYDPPIGLFWDDPRTFPFVVVFTKLFHTEVGQRNQTQTQQKNRPALISGCGWVLKGKWRFRFWYHESGFFFWYFGVASPLQRENVWKISVDSNVFAPEQDKVDTTVTHSNATPAFQIQRLHLDVIGTIFEPHSKNAKNSCKGNQKGHLNVFVGWISATKRHKNSLEAHSTNRKNSCNGKKYSLTIQILSASVEDKASIFLHLNHLGMSNWEFNWLLEKNVIPGGISFIVSTSNWYRAFYSVLESSWTVESRNSTLVAR